MKNPYPYLVALALALPLYVWFVVGCPGLTIDNSTHNHIQFERVLVKDTVETKKLKAENKELREQKYWAQKPRYKVIHDTVYVGHIVEANKKVPQTRNAFPITAEYNARTDNFPPDTLKGKRRKEIRDAHNKEWADLPHRESENELFKPK